MRHVEHAIKDAIDKGEWPDHHVSFVAETGEMINPGVGIFLDPPSGKHSVRRGGGKRTKATAHIVSGRIATIMGEQAMLTAFATNQKSGLTTGTASSTTSRKGRMLRASSQASNATPSTAPSPSPREYLCVGEHQDHSGRPQKI